MSSTPESAPDTVLTGASASMKPAPVETGAGGMTVATRHELGDYEILEELGRGGMGVVYRARQISANRVVALKLIRADQLGAMTAEERRVWLERFRTEAQTTARIEHPNVVTVYDVGMLADSPYYSMRYIGGDSLAVMLRDGPVSNERAAAYLEPVARAVHAAHQHGVVHRDLKPSNILVNGADQPFVADFGLAKWLDAAAEMTHTGEWLGTPSYMSPEHTRDASHVTPASDVYSLGATLYALLTGRPPFAAAHVAEILYQVRHYDPAPPRALNRAVHRDLETVAHQMPLEGARSPLCQCGCAGRRPAAVSEPRADPRATRGDLGAGVAVDAAPAGGPAGLAFASLIALIASGGAAVAVVAYLVTDEAHRIAVTERGRAESERTRAERAMQTIQEMNQTLDQVLYVNRLQTVYRHWLDHDYGAPLDPCWTNARSLSGIGNGITFDGCARRIASRSGRRPSRPGSSPPLATDAQPLARTTRSRSRTRRPARPSAPCTDVGTAPTTRRWRSRRTPR